MSQASLAVKGIGVRFGEIDVLHSIDLEIASGEIHGLIGENGAGKSTLGKVIGGYYRASYGTVSVRGIRQQQWDTPTALSQGIAIMHQELQLVPALTVAQNVYLGLEDQRFGVLRGTERERLMHLMEENGLTLDPDAVTADLTIAEQQKIEILRALARKAEVIVMDEPTSSLSKYEVDQLHRIMTGLRDEGRTVIYVSHFLQDILDVTDRVTVLRNGRLVCTSDTATHNKDSLVSAMLGGAQSQTHYPNKATEHGKVALSVRNLQSDNGTSVAHLDIHAGEIVGLAGLVGAGRSEIARAIIGADDARGEIIVHGEAVVEKSIQNSTDAGVVLVPEDRRKQGLVMSLPVASNISLPHLARLFTSGIVKRQPERELAQSLIEQFNVVPAAVNGDVSNYSGGNQQKVLLSKWLAAQPRVVILDEPSRGVDVGARETIHHAIAALAAQGTAVLLISSEIEEVLGLATRVFLVHRGRLLDEINPNDTTEEQVLATLFSYQNTIESAA